MGLRIVLGVSQVIHRSDWFCTSTCSRIEGEKKQESLIASYFIVTAQDPCPHLRPALLSHFPSWKPPKRRLGRPELRERPVGWHGRATLACRWACAPPRPAETQVHCATPRRGTPCSGGDGCSRGKTRRWLRPPPRPQLRPRPRLGAPADVVAARLAEARAGAGGGGTAGGSADALKARSRSCCEARMSGGGLKRCPGGGGGGGTGTAGT